MYKSRLQELCQKRGWPFPEYSTVKDGPGHMMRFSATVTVQGQLFQTPEEYRSGKEAQNSAARVAFEHFSAPPPAAGSDLPTLAPAPLAVDIEIQKTCSSETVPIAVPDAQHMEPPAVVAISPLLHLSPLPSSLPSPTPGLLLEKNDANTLSKPANGEGLQENCEDSQTSAVNSVAIGSHDKLDKVVINMYKNQLQHYAQKENLGFPVYTTEVQGPPHDRRFRSKVSVGGNMYETLELFSTLKEAEQAAAKVACHDLSVDVNQEDGGVYKNLLQELAQKNGLLCPSYETISSGMSHKPVFLSTVTIGNDTFRGAEMKTKKQAEMNAAKVAYCALTKVTSSSMVSTINECPAADSVSQNIQLTTSIKKHHDSATEEPDQSKRPKTSPENMYVDPTNVTNLHNSQIENSSANPHAKQTAENHPSQQWKTVVYPRNSNMSVPECATVMPYSNEQWVAYKVGVDKEATA